MSDTKEMTTPYTSVGADVEQPLKIFANNSITDNPENYKPEIDYFRQMEQEMFQQMDPNYMKTVSMPELYEMIYPGKPPVIENFLYPGTYLFVGSPKVGKSFMMAQIAYHVSSGIPIWNYPVRKGTVLYLALEDDYRRLQERLYRMFGTDTVTNLFFTVASKSLGSGLTEQLQGFMEEHRDTALIIIDTLQKIRESEGDAYSYAKDYDIIAQLKAFSDRTGVCLLLVHHTRKQKADDNFDMISGTNGLLGAADGAFVLYKEKRACKNAILEISGRDQQEQKLHLIRDTQKLSWELEKAETEIWEEPSEPLLDEIAKIITSVNSNWSGTATELSKLIKTEIPVNALTKKLNVNAGKLFNQFGIVYKSSRTHDGRRLEFHLNKKST